MPLPSPQRKQPLLATSMGIDTRRIGTCVWRERKRPSTVGGYISDQVRGGGVLILDVVARSLKRAPDIYVYTSTFLRIDIFLCMRFTCVYVSYIQRLVYNVYIKISFGEKRVSPAGGGGGGWTLGRSSDRRIERIAG